MVSLMSCQYADKLSTQMLDPTQLGFNLFNLNIHLARSQFLDKSLGKASQVIILILLIFCQHFKPTLNPTKFTQIPDLNTIKIQGV